MYAISGVLGPPGLDSRFLGVPGLDSGLLEAPGLDSGWILASWILAFWSPGASWHRQRMASGLSSGTSGNSSPSNLCKFLTKQPLQVVHQATSASCPRNKRDRQGQPQKCVQDRQGQPQKQTRPPRAAPKMCPGPPRAAPNTNETAKGSLRNVSRTAKGSPRHIWSRQGQRQQCIQDR